MATTGQGTQDRQDQFIDLEVSMGHKMKHTHLTSRCGYNYGRERLNKRLNM